MPIARGVYSPPLQVAVQWWLQQDPDLDQTWKMVWKRCRNQPQFQNFCTEKGKFSLLQPLKMHLCEWSVKKLVWAFQRKVRICAAFGCLIPCAHWDRIRPSSPWAKTYSHNLWLYVLAQTSTFRCLDLKTKSKPPLGRTTLVDLLWGPEQLFRKAALLPGRVPRRVHRQLLVVFVNANHCCLAGSIDLPRPSPPLYFEEQCGLAGDIANVACQAALLFKV